jgi:hypothetical protein
MLNNPQKEPRMDTNKHELILKEEGCRIVGCAMEIFNTFGRGLLEKPYENALVVECGLKEIPCLQQICVHSCLLVVLS